MITETKSTPTWIAGYTLKRNGWAPVVHTILVNGWCPDGESREVCRMRYQTPEQAQAHAEEVAKVYRKRPDLAPVIPENGCLEH